MFGVEKYLCCLGKKQEEEKEGRGGEERGCRGRGCRGRSVKLCNIRPGRTQIVLDREHIFGPALYCLHTSARGRGVERGGASCLSRHLSYLSVTKTLSKHTNNILNIKQKYTQNDVDDDDEDGESQAEMGREGRAGCWCCPSKQKIKAQENLN